MQLIQNNTERDDEEYEALSHIVHEMQVNNAIEFAILSLTYILNALVGNRSIWILNNQSMFRRIEPVYLT